MVGQDKLKVLRIFKLLHRTCQKTFQEDSRALVEVRNKINTEFRKNKGIKNKESVEEMIKLAEDVEKEVRTTVVQAIETEPGKYQLKIRPETIKLDNAPYLKCSR